ncbi:putative phage abortive infection protein [Chryseobacterium sp. SSA4.19]|uniref:putative phage abortive infection protein n=1 Tax=Chryseobacterium sp. SSA4.19 TaxID=2919915 RepID=UPI001F4DB228|nr:putative phage abortive infection protein [Chryseobacterium sp. SSA4.19]MCJ8153259.1 putative phage abortive infection protein [Chryseobacterium sp. SSA4.19]
MKENNDGNIPFYVALALFVILVVLGLTYMTQNSNDYNDRGTFGDMFGFANALFTGLSVVGLIATILLQRKDLNIQRDELKKQTDSIHVQNFENTFFQMLSLYGNFISTIEKDDLKGRNYINHLSTGISRPILSFLTYKQNTIDLDRVRNIYFELHQYNRSEMDHHLRIIYSIIELINTTERVNKIKYFRIFKANVSLDELILLYYGCLYKDDLILKNLIENFPIFEDLLPIHTLHPNIKNYYKKSVYNE